MPRKKKTFDAGKEVKAIARERVGRVPAAKLHGILTIQRPLPEFMS